jgi:hypothetical protein
MLQLPGKHTAFVFSDPAGANACMGFASLGRAFEGRSSLLFCNKRYETKEMENLRVVSEVPDFKSLGIDCVFAGTSHPESSAYFEVHCLGEARRAGIRTISFVDHWVNFRLRFLDENNELVLPDEIWVVDEKAKQLAVEEGLPGSILKVERNPYHQYLEYLWKPSFRNKDYLDGLHIPKEGFHILFAPDPLSLRDGKKTAGFTEDEALEQLLDVLTTLELPVHLIVKCHPLQPVEVLDEAVKKSNMPVHIIRSGDTLELVNASDLVIGFYSNLLLEAKAIGKNVIRFYPGNEKADWLIHDTSIPRLQTKEALLTTIKNYING